jgi:hypothetical protein
LANWAFGSEPIRPSAPFALDKAAAYQQAWAEHLQTPVKVTNSIGMTLSLIPPGEFSMGSPAKEEWHRDDEVLHRVTLSQAFYMGTTEVTQKQWKAFMDEDPSFCTGDELPVETVTWEQVVEFCRKLSAKEGKPYRLPTEAEWEYACRAGTSTPFHTGETIRPDQANYDGTRTYAGGPKGVFREARFGPGDRAVAQVTAHQLPSRPFADAVDMAVVKNGAVHSRFQVLVDPDLGRLAVAKLVQGAASSTAAVTSREKQLVTDDRGAGCIAVIGRSPVDPP